MRLLTRWWFAALLVGVLLLAWAVTVAPWAPWHERTVTEVRLDLHAPADHPQRARSGTFQLGDTRTSISLSTLPAPGTRALPEDFQGSVTWVMTHAGKVVTAAPDWSGNAVLSAADADPGTAALDMESDAPRQDLGLRVTGVASSPASIVVRVSQSRDQVAGLPIPLLLVAVCVVLIGIPATTAGRRRSKPVIFPPTHEHY
jgi:hypothetical protein